MPKLFQNIFFKKFPWRGRKQLESRAGFFRTASRKFSTRYSKTEQCVSFAKNFHPKVSNETENPVLTTPLLFLRELIKKSLSVQKWKKKSERKLFFVKMFFSDTSNAVLTCPSKNSTRSWKLPAHFLKIMKNFICFPNQFFLQNEFIDTKNAVLTGRRTLPAQLPEMIQKKGPQKMPKLFKNIFFKKFPWRGRKQLESPADFFRTANRKFSARYSKNKQFVSFAKNFHPKVSIETKNPVLKSRLLFLRKLVKKSLSVQKWEKI